MGQVWYLIVSIPDLCTLTYFGKVVAMMELYGMITKKLNQKWLPILFFYPLEKVLRQCKICNIYIYVFVLFKWFLHKKPYLSLRQVFTNRVSYNLCRLTSSYSYASSEGSEVPEQMRKQPKVLQFNLWWDSAYALAYHSVRWSHVQ